MSVLSRSLLDTLLSERVSDATETRKFSEDDFVQHSAGDEGWKVPETGGRDRFEKGWEIKTQEKEKVSVDLLTIIDLSSAHLAQGVSGITSVTKGLK